jgi:mono/diheme cytochrome c family protein
MRRHLPLLVLPAVLLLAACGGEPSADSGDAGPSSAEDRASEATTPPGGSSAASNAGDDAAASGALAAGEIDAATLALGKTAYAQGSCIMCHGADGGGARFGPDLTDDAWDHGDGSVASIRQLLVDGIAKGDFVNRDYAMPMPPVTNLITDDEKIDALAKYVWSMSNETSE